MAPLNDADIHRIRADFPILQTTFDGRPLVYLDSAATTHKPRAVLDAIQMFYARQNANISRGVYRLGEEATDLYDAAREKVRAFLGARLACEIVFTRGATEAINLIAQSYGRMRLKAGDEILVSEIEHHSNIVPWQMLRETTGAVLRIIPVSDDGDLLLDEFLNLLTDRTKLVAVTHVSNVLGTLNPIKRIADATHAAGALLVVDGAQSAAHLPVNVKELGCDFFVCSGHKMLGPTGIGVLYGRAGILEEMPPWQGGGGMILSVTFEKTTYNDLPMKFEAGTPPVAEAIGLGAAIDYIERIGTERIRAYEHDLLQYGLDRLRQFEAVRLIGNPAERTAIISFIMNCAHPHDIGQILDNSCIAVRAGHHCAQPLMDRLGLPGTARASLAIYNTRQEIDALASALLDVVEVFG